MIALLPVALDGLTDVPEVLHAVQQVCGHVKPTYHRQPDDPFIQLSYDDLGIESVERLFGYADVAVVNTPVGAPCHFEPVREGTDWLVFPLDGLEKALVSVQPGEIENVDADVLEEVLRCIRFCLANNLLLAIQW